MTAAAATTAAQAQEAARRFVLHEAGFAQVVSRGTRGALVGRSMTAFLNPDWSVDLVQRQQHARLAHWRADPHALVMWVGPPAPGATNEHPHVFDIDTLPPRVVFVRGSVTFLQPEDTERIYRRNLEAQRASGFTRAPVRDPQQVEQDLAGVRVVPTRVRLEGFGEGPQTFEFTTADAGGTP